MGQQLCNEHQTSEYIPKNQHLKITTLYYTQDPLKTTRKENAETIRINKLNQAINVVRNQDQYLVKEDSFRQDSQLENNNKKKKKSANKNSNIFEQGSGNKGESQAYRQQQQIILKDLKDYVPDDRVGVKDGQSKISMNPIQEKVIEKKKNVGNADVPTGALDNKYYPLSNKIIYRGEWLKSQETDPAVSRSIHENDEIHGKGQYFLPDHTYIQAFAEHNKINGYGRLININGDYYEGQFENNKANGIGKYCEGDITYNGGFKDNLPHGNGQQFSDLYVFIGQFENGYKKKGTLTWKNKKDDTDQYFYQGQFSNNLIKPSGKLKINGQIVPFEHFHLK